MLRVVSANVNGIRAAARRGGLDWLRQQEADVLCLQEVRADAGTLEKVLADSGLADYLCVYAAGHTPGRAGVAILSRHKLSDVRTALAGAAAEDAGRWIEAAVQLGNHRVRVASVYVHTGEAQTPRQRDKLNFLAAVTARFAELNRGRRSRVKAVVAGDFNVAHTQLDIKNWRGNIGKSGFLPEEQAHLTEWARAGWLDTVRHHHGETDGPYTWWSWRGKAFDNDAGWRIDYLFASPALAGSLSSVTVGRAASYDQRWSDHAAVVATFDI